MLTHTFQHVPGIGAKTEQALWNAGILSWEDLDTPAAKKIPSRRRDTLVRYRDETLARIRSGDGHYFAGRLPASLHWRLFPEFRKKTAYLDIETTGLDWSCETITTIALYDGESVKTFVRGENLDDFPDVAADYDMLVTYNGKCFDVPFIEGYFDITMDQLHLDLRYLLKSLGYGGGLKGCEKALGIDRGMLDGVDGFFAVLLWHDFEKNGNPRALETLLAYNVEDVVNLEALMVMAYNMNLAATPFGGGNDLAAPVPPPIPFQPDAPTLNRLMKVFR